METEGPQDNFEELSGDIADPPIFIDDGATSGKVIIELPKGCICLSITPTRNKEGYGVNVFGNLDPTMPITISQTIYSLIRGCLEAIKFKKESLFKLAIIAARREQAQQIDPDDVIWNKETPKHYLGDTRAKGNA